MKIAPDDRNRPGEALPHVDSWRVDEWRAEIERSRARTSGLRERVSAADTEPESELVALLELTNTYEELAVAEEELRVQNEELMRTHAAIEVEREHYRRLFHEAPAPYLVTDALGTIRGANAAASALFRIRADRLVGKPLVVFGSEASRRRLRHAIARTAMTDTLRFTIEVTRRDGKTIPVQATVSARRGYTGNVLELRWLFADLRRHRRNEAARRARAVALEALVAERTGELERAQRLKDQLIMTVSHELRTPLTAIGGYAELLLMGVRGDLTPEQHADVERMQRAYEHLTRIVEDLLSYNKLAAGKLSFDIKDIALSDVLLDLGGLVAPQATERGISVTIAAVPSRVVVATDAERLRQVIVNLLGNAVKFTPSGGCVDLQIRLSGQNAVIEVRDTGPGIPDGEHERIFQAFTRLAVKDGIPGTGLGLAISRDMARAMGADVTVTSSVGKGSCFSVWVPLSTRFAGDDGD